MATAIPILEARNVCKRFVGVEALRDVSLAVYPGEVVCLLGDNGAGKSTLIKLLSGAMAPTTGQIFVDGRSRQLSSPRVAHALGIATVHQVTGTIPLLSVSRNFFLGVEPTKGRGPFK